MAPTSTSLSLSWLPPLEGTQNGIIRSYIVHIREVDTDQLSYYNSTETMLVVGPVHPYYNYECSVAAVTISQGPFSDTFLVETPEDGEFCSTQHPRCIIIFLNHVSREITCHIASL